MSVGPVIPTRRYLENRLALLRKWYSLTLMCAPRTIGIGRTGIPTITRLGRMIDDTQEALDDR